MITCALNIEAMSRTLYRCYPAPYVFVMLPGDVSPTLTQVSMEDYVRLVSPAVIAGVRSIYTGTAYTLEGHGGDAEVGWVRTLGYTTIGNSGVYLEAELPDPCIPGMRGEYSLTLFPYATYVRGVTYGEVTKWYLSHNRNDGIALRQGRAP